MKEERRERERERENEAEKKRWWSSVMRRANSGEKIPDRGRERK